MSEKKDIFYLDKVFPNPSEIFSSNFKSENEIIKDGIIILDTNVLLVPFDINEKTVKDIKAIYLKYKKDNRLYIPARVVREFANNRATKISEVFLQIRQLKQKINSGDFVINQYPILHNNDDYNDLEKCFKEIQVGIRKSKNLLERLESHIQKWNWNDNVSTAYKEIFTPELIIEVKKDKNEIEKDLNFRIEYKVAPGYKDSKKPDDGVGDLLIWQTIMEIAKDKEKDVIFVTNDQKNDWFYRQDKTGLYPKFELFDEFRRFTNGKSISIVSFPKFLELSHATEDTIQVIKTTINERFSNEFKINLKGLKAGMEIEHQNFGKGKIIKIGKSGNDETATMLFENIAGSKQFLLKWTPLKIINSEINIAIEEDLDELPF